MCDDWWIMKEAHLLAAHSPPSSICQQQAHRQTSNNTRQRLSSQGHDRPPDNRDEQMILARFDAIYIFLPIFLYTNIYILFHWHFGISYLLFVGLCASYAGLIVCVCVWVSVCVCAWKGRRRRSWWRREHPPRPSCPVLSSVAQLELRPTWASAYCPPSQQYQISLLYLWGIICRRGWAGQARPGRQASTLSWGPWRAVWWGWWRSWVGGAFCLLTAAIQRKIHHSHEDDLMVSFEASRCIWFFRATLDDSLVPPYGYIK